MARQDRRASSRGAGAPRARRLAATLVALALLALAPGSEFGGRAAPTEGDTGAPSLAGRLLVASEKMNDPRFDKTVIYMVEHNAGGAMGLVVNVPIGVVPAAALLERFGLASEGVTGDIHVYFGGPVEPGRGFLLHSTDRLIEGSVPVDDQVALTGRAEMLREIAGGKGPAQSLFTLGYSGWGPGQLESELEQDVWFVIGSDPSLVFAADPATSWQRAKARRSIDL